MSPTLLMKNPRQERDTVIADLRSLLDRRNQQLNVMEQSVGTIEEDRTRIQLHSTETTVTIVSLRRELEEARAGALTVRASEEAVRLQISRMMDEQLAQNQTIDTLRSSNQEVMRHLRALLFDHRVHDKWSFEQLPLVHRHC